MGEGPHSVAAHLGDRAVPVPVVHEPQGSLIGAAQTRLGEHGGRRQVLHKVGRDSADEAVAAESQVTIAQSRHLIGVELGPPCRISDHDEVIAGGMGLGHRGSGQAVEGCEVVRQRGSPDLQGLLKGSWGDRLPQEAVLR